jgi:mRNA-degrading endonuclease RelE of RelBE toxin-antitoxin system
MHWLTMQSTWILLPCFAMMESCRSIHLFLVCDDVASYKVCLKPTVLQDYEAIDSKGDRRRLLWKIGALAENPRCVEARKLPEKEDSYRICLEHHRVIFQIDDLRKQVTVFRIAQRRRQSSTW